MPENLEDKLNEENKNKPRGKIKPTFGDRVECIVLPGFMGGFSGALIGGSFGGQTGALIGCGLGYIAGAWSGYQIMNEYGVKRRVKYKDQLEE